MSTGVSTVPALIITVLSCAPLPIVTMFVAAPAGVATVVVVDDGVAVDVTFVVVAVVGLVVVRRVCFLAHGWHGLMLFFKLSQCAANVSNLLLTFVSCSATASLISWS